MTEPTVDFDMEEVERRLGEGEIRDRIREIKKEAFLAGVRAALTIVLGDRVTKRASIRPQTIRWLSRLCSGIQAT